ncbi:MAG: M48 family metalloprotease [Phycisphaerae bacterium]|nr:M48 family metalloprotease [Phycisphaerae bacterium]
MAVAVLTFALRRRSAHVRYLLWLIVLAKCLVPPLYVVPLYVLPTVVPGGTPDSLPLLEWLAAHSGSPPPASPEGSSVAVRESVPTDRTMQARGRRLSTCGWLGALWIAGVVTYLTVNLLRALRGHRRLRKNRRLLPDDMRADITETLLAYGLKRHPKVWIVENVGQPFVWGLLRGSIYVPTSLLSIGRHEHRRDVLAHELSHMVRFDAGVNVLQVVAQAVFWFHPLVWWANRKIRVEREKCCDETAIARLHTQAKDYCSAVVETLANMKKSPRPVPSLAIAGPLKDIEERIRTMLQPGREFRRHAGLRMALAVLLLATFTVPTTLVLCAKGGTEQATSVSDEGLSLGSGERTPAGASAARLGDLIRTFQDPNVNGRSMFGHSVTVIGNDVLVGAPMNKVAYLFDGSTGRLMRTFVPPDPTKAGLFGFCVGGVGQDVLIADLAYRADPNGQPPGEAYLFNGHTGELLRTFANPQPDNYMLFGRAVAGMGDGRVILQAVSKDMTTDVTFLLDAPTGKVLHVFQQPKSKNVGGDETWVTAIDDQIWIGAMCDDTGAEKAGAVYVFDGATGKPVRTFLNPNPSPYALFGNCIAFSANRVLIGAALATIDGRRSGAVYLFERGTGELLRSFMNPSPSEAGKYDSTGPHGDYFGRSVAWVGNSVLIGTTWDDTGAKAAGVAYLFDGATGRLLHKFANPNPVENAHFGVQVAALGNNILVAARDLGGRMSGTVYLFKGTD